MPTRGVMQLEHKLLGRSGGCQGPRPETYRVWSVEKLGEIAMSTIWRYGVASICNPSATDAQLVPPSAETSTPRLSALSVGGGFLPSPLGRALSAPTNRVWSDP